MKNQKTIIKCKENKQDTCDILNEKLGDCEIVENGEVCWRCPNYQGCCLEEDLK